MKLVVVLVIFLLAASPTRAQGQQTEFLDWHPNGQWLAVSDTQSVKIIDIPSGLVLNEYPYMMSDRTPGGPVAWSLDGMNLAFADSLQVSIYGQAWDPNLSWLVTSYDPLNGVPVSQPIPATIHNLRWSPNNQQIAVHIASIVNIINVVDGELRNSIRSTEFAVNDVAWLSDDRIIVAARQGYAITIDAATGEPMVYLTDLSGAISLPNYTEIALNPSSQQAVIGSSDGELIVWNNTSSIVADFETEVRQWQVGSGYINAVNDLDWDPSGHYVAVSFGNGEVAVYDAASGAQIASMYVGGETVNNAVAWSPDGSQLAYGLPDGGYALFDASTLPGYVPMAAMETTPP